MINLNNGKLRVEIAEPGEHPNDGVRFDRAGFITDVVLDNEMHFCANEPKNLIHPSSGGRGLCCEFQMDLCGKAKVGERYPKIGIGLIKKENDEPYSFFGKYDVEHFQVSWEADETSVTFRTEPAECMGYAFRQEKKISISDATLTIEYMIENVGTEPIESLEYCHNFLSIDGMSLSPDYVIDAPGLPDYTGKVFESSYGPDNNLIANGHGFTLARTEVGTLLSNIDITGISREVPFTWTLLNKGAKASVRIEEGYTPVQLTVWATDHMISPEFKNLISVKPGETQKWSRKLTFAK